MSDLRNKYRIWNGKFSLGLIPPVREARRLLKPLSVVLLLSMAESATFAHAEADFISDGRGGFVVSYIEYALSRDADQTNACPEGMTEGYKNLGDVFPNNPELQKSDDEKEDEYIRRVFSVAFSGDNINNLCLDPELGKPNPTFHTVTGKDVPVFGIDLDGLDSTTGTKPKPGICKHDDFVGMNGERGIDNQFFRVVGCSKSFQSTGQSNTYNIEMLTGAWGILITLDDVDDIRNDDSIKVGIYANADPIQLSPSREPLEYATYAMDQDPRFRATTNGRIVEGVLTTDPVDVRFHKITNTIQLERPLDDARLQLTLGDDGVLEGYLAGYTPVEAMYDLQYGFRNGKDAAGQPAPLRLRAGSSIGQAHVLGHTCEGAYYALHENADADPDPETGQCTSISTQYRIRAIPAFVVDVETESVNEDLSGE